MFKVVIIRVLFPFLSCIYLIFTSLFINVFFSGLLFLLSYFIGSSCCFVLLCSLLYYIHGYYDYFSVFSLFFRFCLLMTFLRLVFPPFFCFFAFCFDLLLCLLSDI